MQKFKSKHEHKFGCSPDTGPGCGVSDSYMFVMQVLAVVEEGEERGEEEEAITSSQVPALLSSPLTLS